VARAGLPVGETTSLPGGVAGARFEVARDRLFAAGGVTVVRALAERLTPTSDGVRITTSGDTISADVAILALGGVVGGGVRAVSAELVPGAIAFELSLEVPGVELALTNDLDATQGCDIGERFELLHRVGIRMDGPRVRGLTRTFAAGDVCNGGAHTVLGAVDSGIAAADAALRDLAD
jgi:thioredoxin reductase